MTIRPRASQLVGERPLGKLLASLVAHQVSAANAQFDNFGHRLPKPGTGPGSELTREPKESRSHDAQANFSYVALPFHPGNNFYDAARAAGGSTI